MRKESRVKKTRNKRKKGPRKISHTWNKVKRRKIITRARNKRKTKISRKGIGKIKPLRQKNNISNGQVQNKKRKRTKTRRDKGGNGPRDMVKGIKKGIKRRRIEEGGKRRKKSMDIKKNIGPRIKNKIRNINSSKIISISKKKKTRKGRKRKSTNRKHGRRKIKNQANSRKTMRK